MNLIDDAIVADSYPIETFLANQLLAAWRPGIFLQIVQCALYALRDGTVQICEVAPSTWIQLDGVVHRIASGDLTRVEQH
jgi:hypothetical protein